jgi:hypothetical protein
MSLSELKVKVNLKINYKACLNLSPKNVPLAECFNVSKEYEYDEDSAGALHAGVQTGSCAAGDWRAEHRGCVQIKCRMRLLLIP